MARKRAQHAALRLSLFVALLVSCTSAQSAEGLDADYDARAHAMCLVAPLWPQPQQGGAPPAWMAPIPRAIHQIWFGANASAWQMKMDTWRRYAATHGYAYRLYTDADVPELAALARNVSPDLEAALNRFYSQGEWRGASDIARYLILAATGGVYVDVDMPPPTLHGQSIDVDRIMPMMGLALTSDGQAVELGTGGLHVLNGLMASSPGHPVLQALLGQLATNIDCALQGGERSAIIMTGPAPLNVVLTGPITIVPIIFWDVFGVPDDSWR